MTTKPVLIDGSWVEADAVGTFQAMKPNTREPMDETYPVSGWGDLDRCLNAATEAAEELRLCPGKDIAAFLEAFAEEIESVADELVEMAHHETALPVSPRLKDVELPRTTGQLRQAAAAAKTGTWRQATLDTQLNIRSGYLGLGPVAVFGPNNFPFAFGSVSGGDFASAIAAGNPVIGKANSSHPGTTRLFGEAALRAMENTGLPRATVQLIYRTKHSDGVRLASDPRLSALGYTGSRSAGLKLKAAADEVGTPIYLELSSINPVVILPGALSERGEELVGEFAGSCLMGTGQFCTNPGIVFVIEDSNSNHWLEGVTKAFADTAAGTLLSTGVEANLKEGIDELVRAGATRLTPAGEAATDRCSLPNTLLSVSGSSFIEKPEAFQAEAFGNESLIVVCTGLEELVSAVRRVEGNLTGCVYSAADGSDDEAYHSVESVLRTRVGRLLNDKMPTGVAVSPAMNHGGPFPATGHPGTTAVGMPASIHRFAMLACYDAVRPERLPSWLQDDPGEELIWRSVDGTYQQGSLG